MPVEISALPALSAILISHDHYDHLDYPTVLTLLKTQTAPFVVPLGIGSHLRAWGVPNNRIVELGWGQQTQIGNLEFECIPARHFSGRTLARDYTLWSSWALRSPAGNVFFGGDTGYSESFKKVSGEFELTVLPIGAYSEFWPDIHLNPEQAWQLHQDITGGVLLPIHWASFDLAFHSWDEPIERLLRSAHPNQIALPVPGQRFDLDQVPQQPWWR